MTILSNITNLNPAQSEAVECTEGPLIVLAGAGSGKTKTLTTRVVHLIEKGISPASILAVTFTNKAAAEMKQRITHALSNLPTPVRTKWAEPWMGFSPYLPEVATFHSFCLKVLRMEHEAAGLLPGFTIYDDGDQLSLLKKIIGDLNLEGRLGNAKAYQAAINHAKTQSWNIEEILGSHPNAPFREKVIEVFEQYQNKMKESQALDFGDIIICAAKLFHTNSPILERYQERFRYLMVDEYQDTNRAQYLLISLLAKKYRNLCVVGDEDQSIYKWRGADIRNILDFQQEYPEAKCVKLEENYRSTKKIIEAASAVIRNNKDRYEKTLFTNNQSGDPIKVISLSDERAEADYLTRSIVSYIQKDPSLTYKNIAIFYRSHAQSRALEDSLRRDRIPYQIIGGLGFYERKEIKDVMAYLRVAVNPMDSISLERIINVPARGIGKATMDKLFIHANQVGIPLFRAIEEVVRGQTAILSANIAKKLAVFYDFILDLQQGGYSLQETYQRIVQDSGYLIELRSEGTEEAKARIENLEEFSSVIQNFENDYAAQVEENPKQLLANFINQLSLENQVFEKAEENGMGFVSLMTLHSSKGLEFPLVYLVGCEEGLFPSKRAIEESEWEDSAIEEERRLCYVGITRAKRYLILTHTVMRRIYGQVQVAAPSRFLEEIPSTHKLVEDRSASASSGSWIKKTSSSMESARVYDYTESQIPVEIGASYGSRGESISVGRKVLHAVYGKGVVKNIEGATEDRKITIEFSGYQKKKFLLRHVKLELL